MLDPVLSKLLLLRQQEAANPDTPTANNTIEGQGD